MESTSAAHSNDKSRRWSLPRQNRRNQATGNRYHDGFSGRLGAAAPNPGSGAGDRRRTPGRRDLDRVRPPMAAIIIAVQEMREDRPRISVSGLYQQFRCRGGRWALVTREDVRFALAGIESAARRKYLTAAGTEVFRRSVPRTPQGSWPQFRQAVTDRCARGVDVDDIVRELRELGWRRVGADDVAGVLRRHRSANAGRHFAPGRSLPAPRQAAPGLCPACGVLVTDLGRCRCS